MNDELNIPCEDWNRALTHLSAIIAILRQQKNYESMHKAQLLQDRYNKGERSIPLFTSMMLAYSYAKSRRK